MAHEDPAATAPGADAASAEDIASSDADSAASAVVTRTVDIDAAPAEVWQAVADPGEWARWLDDPDAAARRVRVDESSPGDRLVWTWWRPGDEGDASTVSVVLAPVEGGGTRVVVTESMPAPVPVGTGFAQMSARAGATACARAATAMAAAGRPRRVPAWLRCAGDRWDGRLLGLELLFVAARVAVA